MKKIINREMDFIGGKGGYTCQCNVPSDLHGTCCGWVNASVKVSVEFIIMDQRHPGLGQNLNTWKQKELQR